MINHTRLLPERQRKSYTTNTCLTLKN